MIYQLELQNCVLSQATTKYVDYQTKKLDRYLPDFAQDLPLLHLFIEYHETKSYFDGSITLHLPKQAVNAHFKSNSIDQAVKRGFQKIRRELKNRKFFKKQRDCFRPEYNKILALILPYF